MTAQTNSKTRFIVPSSKLAQGLAMAIEGLVRKHGATTRQVR
jgi:hypothetical protein